MLSRQQCLDWFVCADAWAGDHFAGFFEVQFDFKAGLLSLRAAHRWGRPRLSSDEM
jgi:hypothetical protein